MAFAGPPVSKLAEIADKGIREDWFKEGGDDPFARNDLIRLVLVEGHHEIVTIYKKDSTFHLTFLDGISGKKDQVLDPEQGSYDWDEGWREAPGGEIWSSGTTFEQMTKVKAGMDFSKSHNYWRKEDGTITMVWRMYNVTVDVKDTDSIRKLLELYCNGVGRERLVQVHQRGCTMDL